MATQLLGGFLSQRFGGKVCHAQIMDDRPLGGGCCERSAPRQAVISNALLWFSVATALTPLSVSPNMLPLGLSLPMFLAARALVGLGEGTGSSRLPVPTF